MALAIVQNSGKQTFASATTRAFTFSANPTIGNKIVVVTTNWTATTAAAVSSIADSQSNTYNKRHESQFGENRVTIWEADIAATGASFQTTVTFASASYGLCVFLEVAGLSTGNSADAIVTAGIRDTTPTSFVIGACPGLAQAYELAFTAFCCTTQTTTSNVQVPQGWDFLAVENDSTNILCVGVAYRVIENGVAPEALRWFHTAIGTNDNAGLTATLKASGSPPANPPSPAFNKSLRRGIGAANSGR